jgi:hypothetical protein
MKNQPTPYSVNELLRILFMLYGKNERPLRTCPISCTMIYRDEINQIKSNEVMEAHGNQDGCKCCFVLFIVQDKYWNL